MPPTLFIQIPCFNEETTLPTVLRQIPTNIQGISDIKTLVIDDGSSDRTAEVAHHYNVTEVLRLRHVGLAQAFYAGLQRCVELGGDIIVNIDGDNQYDARDITLLVAPILAGDTLITIGKRDIVKLPYFSRYKKILHLVGNWVMRSITATEITDATSGFRAIHRTAAKKLTINSSYTYTIEMLLQMAFKGIPYRFIPIRCNEKVLRPSRLIRSNREYILKNCGVVVRYLLEFRLRHCLITFVVIVVSTLITMWIVARG